MAKQNILITDYEECAKGPKPNWKQVNGFWIDLHPKNIDVHVSGAFYRNSVWENDKFSFLDSLGAKTFVDIGANIGVFTLQALHKGYNVIAVEGADLNIQRLCSSIVKNKFKNIKLYKAVVWDDDIGTLNFESPKENAGGTHVDITNTNTGVPKVLLDTVISGLTDYVMKIDIEAAECRAFKSHFFDHPAKGLTMEWGNLKVNKKLCPQRMYEELVKNISISYGKNLLLYNGWDAPPLTLQKSAIPQQDCFTSYDGPMYDIVNIPFKGKTLKIAVYKRTATQSDIVSNVIKQSKFWDRSTVNTIMRNLNDGYTFVDIGANIGWFTILVASQGYEVHAIEPFKSNVKLLRLSLCLNPEIGQHVTVHNHGLGVVSEDCDLFQIATVNIGDTHSICDDKTKQSFLAKGYKKIGSMKTKSLDDMIMHKELQFENWILKIDTEGYEAKILKGAQNLLKSNPPHFIATEYTTSLLEGNSVGDAYKYADILFTHYNIYDGSRQMNNPSDIVGGNFELLKCYIKK